MNDIIVSRIISGTDQYGDPVMIMPGRYPFMDEIGKAGENLRTVIELPDRSEAGISESDYPAIRQEIA